MHHQHRRGRTRRCSCRRRRPHAGWLAGGETRVRASASQPSAAAPRVAVVPGSTPARARTQPVPGPVALDPPRPPPVGHRHTGPARASLCFRPTAPGPPTARVRVHATRARAARPKPGRVVVKKRRKKPGRVAARNCYAPPPLGERKERGEHDGGPTRDRCRPRLAVRGAHDPRIKYRHARRELGPTTWASCGPVGVRVPVVSPASA
jgi:hypothetical protein